MGLKLARHAEEVALGVGGGTYHLINRGNYRSAIFGDDKTKVAFLDCVGETCARTGWIGACVARHVEPLNFDRMCRGWVIGAPDFKKALMREHQEEAAGLARGDDVVADLKDAVLREELEKLLRLIGKSAADIAREGKSVAWKLAVAAAMKARTVVTNRWLAENLAMGNRYEVSRKVQAWSRHPEPKLARKLQLTPNPKT